MAPTPTAVAVQSSMADIILAAMGYPIVGPPTVVVIESFASVFLGHIRVAVEHPCMTAGRADVVME